MIHQLLRKTVTYTATDRWGKETTINRKIIVRPDLYKNTFKIFSDVNEEEMISESDSTENKKIYYLKLDLILLLINIEYLIEK